MKKFLISFKEGWKNAKAIFNITAKYKGNSDVILAELRSEKYSSVTESYVSEMKNAGVGLQEWRRYRAGVSGYSVAGFLFFIRHGKISQMSSN